MRHHRGSSGGRSQRLGTTDSQLKIRGVQLFTSSTALNVSEVTAQIDKAVTLGANCLKWGALNNRVYSAGYTIAQLLDYHTQILDYAASKGLYVYAWLYDSFGDVPQQTTDRWTAITSQVVALWETRYPRTFIGYDMVNEGNLSWGWPATLTHCQTVRNLIRNAGYSTPLSTGISAGNDSQLWNANTVALAPSVDFYDFHPYWGVGDPAVSNLTSSGYRGSAAFKPFLIGECGQNTTSGAKQSRATALGTLSAEADSYGSIWYTVDDLSNNAGGGYGIWDSSGVQNTALAAIVSAWPKHAP